MENKRRNNTIEIDKDKFRFDVDVYIFREEEHMTAYCPSLDLATTGTDFQDALKNFYECLQLHVECCLEMGTFKEDLKEHGWKVSKKKIVPPSFRWFVIGCKDTHFLRNQGIYFFPCGGKCVYLQCETKTGRC